MSDSETLQQIELHLRSIESMLADVIGAQMAGYRTTANNYQFAHKRHKRKAPGKHTREQWQQLKAIYGFTCLACGRKEPEIRLTRDHVIPIDAGGSDGIENIQPLCEDCNNKKAAANVDYRPTYDPSEADNETTD